MNSIKFPKLFREKYNELNKKIDLFNEYLESVNYQYRYSLKKTFLGYTSLKFFVIDECENDTQRIASYMKLNNAITCLKNLKIKDLDFDTSDKNIKELLSSNNIDTIYDLIKSKNLIKIKGFGKGKINVVNKTLNKYGLHVNMSTLDIYNSPFFSINKFQLKEVEF